MKRRFTILLAALLLSCGLSWAQTTDVLNHDLIGVNGTTYSTWTGITSNSDAVYAGNTAGGNNAIQMRSTNNNSGIVTTASGGVVTNITVVWNENTTAGRTLNVYGKNAAYSAATDLYGNNAGTLIGTIVYNAGASTELDIDDEYAFIGIRSNSGALYLNEVSVTWSEGSGVTPPSITVNNVEITYDTDADEIEYEINNAVDGGVLTASTESDWLTLGEVGATVPFTCSVNQAGAAREAVVTLTYTYGEQAINQAVTVTQAGNPNAVDNISDITATGAYAVQGTIVAKSQRGFIVGDGTGYVYYYNQNYNESDYAIGDMVKLAGSVVVYGGVFEFNNSTTITPANSSNYVAEEPTVITGEEMDARVASTTPAQLSSYVQYEGTLSVDDTHYNITNIAGATTAIGSISYPLDTELASLDGKQVRVTGYYVGISSSKYYNTMIGSVEEVINAEPSITVTPATLTVDAQEHLVNYLDLAYENIDVENAGSFTVHYYNAEGEEIQVVPDEAWMIAGVVKPNDVYQVLCVIIANEGEARTAYFKLSSGETYSNLVTVNQEAYEAPTYAELPFSFDGGKAAIEETEGLYQEGLGTDYASAPKLKFDGAGDWLLLQFDERPGTLTFDIKGNGSGSDPWDGVFKVMVSTNGVNFVDKVVYETGDLTSTKTTMTINDLASDVRFIKWVYDTKTLGNVALGNIALAEYVAPQEYTLTVEPFENLELITFVNDEMVMEGDGEIQVTNGNQIMLSIVAMEGYVMETLMVNGVNHVNDIADDFTYTFEMPAENVTISATAVEDVPPTPGNMYVKVTSTNDLTSGQYLIVYEEGNVAFDGGLETLDAAGNTIGVTIQNDEISITAETAAAEFTIDMTAGTIKSASGLYIGQTSDANGMQSSAETAYTNTISIDEVGNAVVVSSNAHLRYNNASNQNRFRYYKSASYSAQKAIQLYKKVETLPANSIVIEGYGNSEGGYYLIASPFTVSPEDVQGMTEDEYDLYSFDEAEENEWRNYKAGAFENLEPGKGYLYAHSTTVTLTFDGEAYNGDPIVLQKTSGGDFEGWNLVGNPYTETAYIDHDFYVMNPETGGEIITGKGNEIAAMQGFFVIAANDGEELEISTTAPANQGGKIVMNVSNGRSSVIDRAMVRFGEGRTLPKFMLNDENTKIYITEGNEDFAVVRSIDENATPVSFHAAENGTYTLSINAENVEMEYLHLRDNMTGADVDLLATPSYTFEARTTDYANRFKLVYATTTDVNENNVEPFAFFNGSEWVINNEGEATLQVIDINGRMLSNETVNGNANVNINATSGIYMLRLVNGESVKTQKVVVK